MSNHENHNHHPEHHPNHPAHSEHDKVEHFHAHKVHEHKTNPIEELMDLYKESETIDKEITHKIEEVEHESDSSLKNLIIVDRKKRRTKFIAALIGFFVMLAAVSGAMFLYFGGQVKFSEEDIKVEITGPERVKVNESVTYTIKYRNFSQMEITNAKMLVQYPHGFIVDSTEPPIQDHRWALGNFVFNEGGELKITGRIIDDLNREQKIVATMYYQPDGFTSEFTRDAAYSTIIESPDVAFMHNFPAVFTLGQKQNLTIKMKNNGTVDFTDAKLALSVPESFKVAATKPAQTENKDWIIPALKVGAETEAIMVEGQFPEGAGIGDGDKFKFQLYLKGLENNYYLVKTEELPVKTTEQAVTSALIVNGSTENKHVEFGTALTFTAVAKNGGEDTFENIKIRTVINSAPLDIIDWEKISDSNYGKIQKIDGGKEIVWSKAQIAALLKFAPKNEQTINFSLPIKTIVQLKDADKNLLAKTSITGYSEIVIPFSDGSGETKIKSSEVKLILDTNVDLTAKALYSLDGTVIGSGPMPPRVGQATKVVVFWEIKNDLHEISEITVGADLPENVKFTETQKISAGELKFDQTTKKVIWTINRLPRSVTSANASFTLEFTPGSSDLGKIVKLTGNNILSVKDTETENIIAKTKNILTSVLDEDEMYSGQGTVVP
jgi:hypothetical protein